MPSELSTPGNSPDQPAVPPAPGGRAKPTSLLACAGAAVLLLAGGGVAALLYRPSAPARADLRLHRVGRERLELTIVQRGDLEPARSSDIECRVRAGSKNNTVATTIKWVIDDGTPVRGPRPEKPTGDRLVELDDSGLREQLQAQRVAVKKAESDKILAEEAYKITVSQNQGDVKAAETQVELAALDLVKYTGLSKDEVLEPATAARLRRELKGAARDARRTARQLAAEDLKKYRSGDYLAALKDGLDQVETAETDLSQQEDREAWAYRMAKKGYQTAHQAQLETSRKESYQLVVNKALLGLDVLVKYTKVGQLTQYLGALEEARRALARTTAQARSKEVQARIDRRVKESVWGVEMARQKDYEAEIARCQIYAPHDGLVLYFVPEQARSGSGSQLSIVAQGEPVREGQTLMQLPDLGHMQVSTMIHEAAVSRVHAGQPALIRVDAYPDVVLHGHVRSVATFASQRGWSLAEVRAYITKVTIDPEGAEGLDLKPGLSAEVTISGNDPGAVLTVPTEAIVGGSELGGERKVFVMTADGPEERTVTVGTSNGHLAEIKEGLSEGDEVVENPAALPSV